MRLLCVILVILGLAVSGHLLVRHFTLTTAQGPVTAGTCSTLFQFDCDATLRSPLASRLGVPMAGWGLIYYGTLAVLLLLGWANHTAFGAVSALAALAISLAGAVVSLVLSATMLTGAVPPCPFCFIVHVINWALLPLFFRATGRPARELWAALRRGGASLVGPKPVDRPALAGLLVTALVALVLYQAIAILALQHPPVKFDVRHALASFAMSQRVDIPRDDAETRIGPADAAVRLVVFTDFECPGCARFALELARTVGRQPTGLCVVFKHFPAGSACNPSVGHDLHPRACAAARAAEAARLQGAFWPFHDSLFALGAEPDEAKLTEIATDAELDLERFEADRHGQEVLSKVRADVALGIRLGVDETPTVFLNGRRAPDVSMQTLHLLIRSELANLSLVIREAELSAD